MSQGTWQRDQMGAGCQQQPQPGRNVACVKNCGFFGNETTLNMCPNCYRAYLSMHAGSTAAPPSQASPLEGTSIVEPDASPLVAMASASSADDSSSPDVAGSPVSSSIESDTSLLARSSVTGAAPSLGTRARFPRVQSASEGATREYQSPSPVAATLAVGSHEDCCEFEGNPQPSCTNAKVEVPADSLVRSNASRALDVDMYHQPGCNNGLLPPAAPKPPAVVSGPPRPVLALSASGVKPNRCDVCRKKVGLTGFKCRCKGMFCGLHRYSDTHSCSFDYKAAGRDAIAKANPVVKADKVLRF